VNAPAYKLPGVNLFASGIYRGQPWPPARVRGIAENIRKNKTLLVPPAVLGHEEDQEWLERTDLPAAGWVDPDSVQCIPDPDYPGQVLLTGDVVNVPPEVASLIRDGSYANCSGEFYELMNDFAESQGFTMRRLGLLGGEVPQVKRLGRLPMPVPMTELKVFAEAAVVLRPCDTGQFLSFAERQTMDRAAAMTAILAALPGLSQATLDALTDDALKDMVAHLPAPAAPVVPMDDAPAPAGPTRDEMIAALVGAGQDQATVAAMSDADLKAAFDLVKGAAPVAMDDKPDDKKKPETANMSETEKKAAASLKRINDLEASAALRDKAAAARERKTKTKDAESFCEQLVRDGRLLPFQKADYLSVLVALDDSAALHKFSDGKGNTEILTAYERKKRELALRPPIVKFGEKVTGGGTGTPDAKAAAITKAREFATVQAQALKAGGYKDPEAFVTKFTEIYDKDAKGALSIIA
jgi:hypothetical protein